MDFRFREPNAIGRRRIPVLVPSLKPHPILVFYFPMQTLVVYTNPLAFALPKRYFKCVRIITAICQY